MRIGVLGGTFDPIHNGHLQLAQAALDQYRLDEVWFVPSCIPPHKAPSMDRASAEQRLEMVKLAVASEPRFKVATEELDRKGVSYTFETMRDFRRKHPADDFFLILGADAYRDFSLWKNADEIRSAASLLIAARAGQLEHEGALPEGVFRIEMPECAAASTRIRNQIADTSETASADLPPSVFRYILQHHLYKR